MSKFAERLLAEFSPFGQLSLEQVEKLEAHYAMLLRWNQKMNLTRIENLEDAVRFHYCESLFLAKCLPPGKLQIADVGSGAGFPGIPLAIFRQDCSVHLIESNQRKAVFLAQASSTLQNVTVLPARAEDCGVTFDWVVGRAVRPADVLSYGLANKSMLLMNPDDAIGLSGVVTVDALPWGDHRSVVKFG